MISTGTGFCLAGVSVIRVSVEKRSAETNNVLRSNSETGAALARHKSQESRVKTQDSRVKTQESRLTQESRVATRTVGGLNYHVFGVLSQGIYTEARCTSQGVHMSRLY